MITLEQLLESRDNRARHQRELLGAFPGRSLICFTVQLPGPEKRNEISLKIGEAGVQALKAEFGESIEHLEVKDLETGFEAYLIVPFKADETKRRCCAIEDTHPWGRLMDIDVPGTDRAAVGLPARKCLLCNNEVRYCMRAKLHTQEELLAKISEIVRKPL